MIRFLPFLDGSVRKLLELNVDAALLTILVGLVIWATRHRLSARLRHALWILVAVRLCLPALPTAPFRLGELVGGVGDSQAAGRMVVVGQLSADGSRGMLPPNIAPPPAALREPEPHASRAALPWTLWLAMAWFLGSAFLSVRLAWACGKQRRHLSRLKPIIDADVLGLLEDCARAAGVRRPPILLSGGDVDAPALVGFLRPKILLPGRLLTPEAARELRHVLFHELAHLRRSDVLLQWAVCVLEIVHWPNLLARLAFVRARLERELACDDLALGWSGDDPRAYAASLVSVAEAVSGFLSTAGAAGIVSRKRPLELRLRSLLERERRKPSRALGWTLFCLCAMAGLACTSARQVEETQLQKVYALGALADVPLRLPLARLGELRTEEAKPPVPAMTEQATEARREHVAAVAAGIRSDISDDLWRDWMSLEVDGDNLVVKASAQVHERVSEALRKLLEERELVVFVESKLLAIDAARLAALPVDFRGSIEALRSGAKASRRSVSADELRLILEPGAAEGHVQVEGSPVLIVRNQQSCQIFVTDDPLLDTVDLQVVEEADGRKTFKPDTATLHAGFSMQVLTRVQDSRDRVSLEIQGEWADVKKPRRIVEVKGILIHMPEVSLRAIQENLDARSGEWMLLTAFDLPPWHQVVKGPDGCYPEPSSRTLVWLVKAEVRGPK